jgi:hypothetical protein
VEIKPMPDKIIPFTIGSISSLTHQGSYTGWTLKQTEKCTFDERDNPVWEIYQWHNATYFMILDEDKEGYHKYSLCHYFATGWCII